jgi:hypothetical protein
MASAYASVQPYLAHIGRLIEHLPSAADVRRLFPSLCFAGPRVGASVTLAGVVASAGLAPAFSPRPATPPATIAVTQADTASTAATGASPAHVKIIGATPRSENCAEQVWPYIERRCLTRTVDQPRVHFAPAAVADANRPAAPTAPQAAPASRTPGDSAPLATPVSDPARLRVATAHLSPPARRPIDVLGPDGVRYRLVPMSQDWLRDRPSAYDVRLDSELERPMVGEPRRRIGRRAQRSRYGRSWGSGHFFGFRF